VYYGNKVMQEFKSKYVFSWFDEFLSSTLIYVVYLRDPKHVEWVKSFLAVLEEMRKYVMEYHTTGLSWNPKV
jgi:hypothetical protein